MIKNTKTFAIESKYVKIYCYVCNKHGKSRNIKISYIVKKAWSLSIVHSKYGDEYEKIYIPIAEKNLNQEFRLKKIDETRSYLTGEINQNKLVSKKLEKVSRALNYLDYSLIVISTITGCISISGFPFLVGIYVGTASSTKGLRICAITVGIKKYESIITRKKEKDDKIILLAKSKLSSIDVLISKALIDSKISHDGFILINNVSKGFYDMKEEIKNSNTK